MGYFPNMGPYCRNNACSLLNTAPRLRFLVTYLDGLVVKVEAGDHGTLDVEQTEGGTPLDVEEEPFDKRLGEVLLLPLRTMSRIRVSMGVLPTSRKKKTCSMTWEDTVRSDGNLNLSLIHI